MFDASLKRNGEQYNDPTAFQAMGSVGEGEIYTKGDQEILIVRCHEGFCNVLTLLDEPNGKDCIEVRSRCIRYTNPAMLSYRFIPSFTGEFVRILSESEFQKVLQAVGKAMGITETKEVIKEVPMPQPKSPSKEAIYKEMCEELLEKFLKNELREELLGIFLKKAME